MPEPETFEDRLKLLEAAIGTNQRQDKLDDRLRAIEVGLASTVPTRDFQSLHETVTNAQTGIKVVLIVLSTVGLFRVSAVGYLYNSYDKLQTALKSATEQLQKYQKDAKLILEEQAPGVLGEQLPNTIKIVSSSPDPRRMSANSEAPATCNPGEVMTSVTMPSGPAGKVIIECKTLTLEHK